MTKFSYDHVHLRSPDPDETARYYERMFGAEIIKSVMSNGIERTDIKLGGVMFFIAQVPADADLAEKPESSFVGLDHLGCGSATSTAVAAELKAKARSSRSNRRRSVRRAHRLCSRPAERPDRAPRPRRLKKNKLTQRAQRTREGRDGVQQHRRLRALCGSIASFALPIAQPVSIGRLGSLAHSDSRVVEPHIGVAEHDQRQRESALARCAASR